MARVKCTMYYGMSRVKKQLSGKSSIKIETSWAKKVVKSILETWNDNAVYSRIKKFKNMQYKKEQF